MLLLWGTMMAAGPSLKGQDIHFSQVDINPVLFNPAYAGFFDGNGRFGVVYRNQWGTVSEPFSTFAATAEFAITRNRKHRNGLSAGLIFDSDRAGALSYGTTALSGVLSFFQSIGQQKSSLLSVAVLCGFGQMGFNPQSASLYDPSEEFNHPQVSYKNLGAGIAFYHQFLDEFDIRMGLSAWNINKPNISYLGLVSVCIFPRITAYVRSEYRFYNDFSVLPIVAYQHQNEYSELLYGADVKWYLDHGRNNLTLSAGLLLRHKDAAMVNMSVEYDAFIFAFSYDANISYLATASHTIGAFELGVVYRMASGRSKKKNSISCPVF